MAEIKGADLLAKSLKEQGVEYMFGVVGFPVGPIAEAAQKVGLPYIGMRNEQAASYAAGAVGFLTGRPGSCITVTGPGVIHGLAGLEIMVFLPGGRHGNALLARLIGFDFTRRSRDRKPRQQPGSDNRQGKQDARLGDCSAG